MNCYAYILAKCNYPNSEKAGGHKIQITTYSIKPFFLDLNQGSVSLQRAEYMDIA